MALSEDFNYFEHLPAVLQSLQNRIFREEFNDLGNNFDNDDITIPRSSLKVACWLRDKDTASIMLLKMILFYLIVRSEDLPAIYGIPVAKLKSEAVAYKPQYLLKFVGDRSNEREQKQGILESEISFRLMWENTSVTQIKSLARTIFSELATPPFTWKKGTSIFSYWDVQRGYELKLYVSSFQEGERVVRKILGIQNHPFELDFCNISESKANFPVNPGTKIVLGKTKKKIRRRPIGNVTFYSATFDWAELNEPIRLVGPLRGGRRGSPELLYK